MDSALYIAYGLLVATLVWFVVLMTYYRKSIYDMVVGDDGQFQWSEAIMFVCWIFMVVGFFTSMFGLPVPTEMLATIDLAMGMGLTGSIYTKTNGKKSTDSDSDS